MIELLKESNTTPLRALPSVSSSACEINSQQDLIITAPHISVVVLGSPVFSLLLCYSQFFCNKTLWGHVLKFKFQKLKDDILIYCFILIF